jgi:hypothetical protein
MGSDTRTIWAGLLYAAGFLLVLSLLAARLLTPPAPQRPHPYVALVAGVVAVWSLSWAVSGPLAPGWGLVAGGQRATAAGSPSSVRPGPARP